jgi:hypothetical protein
MYYSIFFFTFEYINIEPMKAIKLLLLWTILLISNYSVFADQIQGGEITWTCDGSGNFIFTVKLYRDCNGSPSPSAIVLKTNAPGFAPGIVCNIVSNTNLSPSGTNCPTCTNPLGMLNSMSEVVYKSSAILLVGVPPSTGWYFAHSNCCRNGSLYNLYSNGTMSYTFRSIMYPYNGQNTSPCFDNSPQFSEKPLLATCKGNMANYSHSAYDSDLDSLRYEWGQPLEGYTFPTSTIISFTGGFTYNSPLPNSNSNPANIGATLNSANGLINFLCNNQGDFLTVVKVSSYKCGIKTAEIFREIPISVVNCVISGTTLNTDPDITGGLAIENFHMVAGDSLSLLIRASDLELQPASAGGGFQTITLTHSGQNFGDGDTSTTIGCLVPPCATMTPPTPVTNNFAASSTFKYVTSCQQAGFLNGCLQHQRKFSFLFNFKDNFCPANGSTIKIVNVYVSGPDIQLLGNDLTISYPGATYQWFLNGNPIVGATDSIYTPVQSGIYTVIVTTNAGCEMISNAVNISITGLNVSTKNDSFISVYPNPTLKGGMLNVVFSGVKKGENNLQVLDINGRLIKQFNVQLNSESEHLVLDVSDVSAGVYTMSLKNGNEITSKGFVIK